MDIGLTGAIYKIKRIASADLKFRAENRPDFSFENPFDKDSFLRAFALVPDVLFQASGFIKVQINGRILIPPTTESEFKEIADFNMPIPDDKPIIFEAGKKLEVWIASGSGIVFLTIGLLVSEG